MIRLIIALLVILSMRVPLALCAELGGTVVDYVGATQPHAKVQLLNSKSKMKRIGATSADGKFRFADLPAGEYELKVSRACLKTFKKQITLDADSRMNLDINLKLADKRCLGID